MNNLKVIFFNILPFVKSKTVKYFVDVWLEKHPEIKHNSFVVYVFDPKKDFQEGHAVAIVDGVVHDNRKNNSKRQKDELEKWPILGFSMV